MEWKEEVFKRRSSSRNLMKFSPSSEKKKKKSLLSVRLCRQTTAHCVPAGPLMCYLNINDAILHCFIINSSTFMLVVALE